MTSNRQSRTGTQDRPYEVLVFVNTPTWREKRVLQRWSFAYNGSPEWRRVIDDPDEVLRCIEAMRRVGLTGVARRMPKEWVGSRQWFELPAPANPGLGADQRRARDREHRLYRH